MIVYTCSMTRLVYYSGLSFLELVQVVWNSSLLFLLTHSGPRKKKKLNRWIWFIKLLGRPLWGKLIIGRLQILSVETLSLFGHSGKHLGSKIVFVWKSLCSLRSATELNKGIHYNTKKSDNPPWWCCNCHDITSATDFLQRIWFIVWP